MCTEGVCDTLPQQIIGSLSRRIDDGERWTQIFQYKSMQGTGNP